jgi:hypothetical protein
MLEWKSQLVHFCEFLQNNILGGEETRLLGVKVCLIVSSNLYDSGGKSSNDPSNRGDL